MRTTSLRAQLNRYLYQEERQFVNAILAEVDNDTNRDAIRLALLVYIRFGITPVESNAYRLFIISGLRPFVDRSLEKADDSHYNVQCPEDHPIENDRD